MEFNKKEKGIKEILERRKIQPSDELWNKLEQQMDDKNQFSYSTLRMIAAILVIVLSIGGIFYFNSSEVIPDGIVNEDSSPKSLKEENEKTKIIPSFKLNETENETLNSEKNIAVSQTEILHKTLKESPEKSTGFSENIEPKEKFEDGKTIAVKVDKEKENSFENPKIDRILDSIEMELSLEEETLSLLAEAAEKTIAQKRSKLDADALLTEIDQEISEESDVNLRDKMQDMLKESWDKAKSALALNK